MWDKQFWEDPRGWWSLGGHRGPGRRIRRGAVKLAILHLLAEGARHGYDVMQQFRERGWGAPAPSSIYPVLAVLEEAGLVTSREQDGKRVYTLTDEGRSALKEHADRFEEFFGSISREPETPNDALRESVSRLMRAVSQLGTASKPETIARVRELIDATRKEIYTLLAEE